MPQRLVTSEPAARPHALPCAHLFLIRTDAAAGTARIIDLCGAHGLSPEAINLAGRSDDRIVVAVEVPADIGTRVGMLEDELRGLPGVQSVTVTPVGVSARGGSVENKPEEELT